MKPDQFVYELCKSIIDGKDYKVLAESLRKTDRDNFDEILQTMLTQRVFPTLYPYVLDTLTEEQLKVMDEEHQYFDKNISQKLEELKRLQTIAEKHGYHFILEKGLPLSNYLYDNPFSRETGDLDVVLREKDCLAFVNLLIDQYGYETYSLRHKLIGTEKQFLLETPITMFPLHRDMAEIDVERKIDDKNYISIDVKRGSSAIFVKYMDTFFQHVTSIQIEGIEVDTYDIPFTFLQLLANTYSNARPVFAFQPLRLRDYLDIAFFLKKYAIDWNMIYKAAQEMNLTVKIGVVLDHFTALFPSFIDSKIINMFQDSLTSEALRLSNGIPVTSPFTELVFDYDRYRKEIVRNMKKKYYYEDIQDQEIRRNQPIELYQSYEDYKIADAWFYKNQENFDFFIKIFIPEMETGDYRVVLSIFNDDLDNSKDYEILEFAVHQSAKTCLFNGKPHPYEFSKQGTDFMLHIPFSAQTILKEYDIHNRVVYRLLISQRFSDRQFRVISRKYDLFMYDMTLGVWDFAK